MATIKSLGVIFKFFISLLCIKTICTTITVFKDNKEITKLVDEPSMYGGPMFESIDGLIVPAEPFDACSKIQPAPQYANFSSFVLISHNETFSCTVYNKIYWATLAGFDLAVIMQKNSVDEKQKKTGEPKIHVVLSHEIVKKGKVKYEDSIPTVIVSAATGALIFERFTFKNETSDVYWLRVTPDKSTFKLVVLFAIVIVICFMIMLLFMVCLLVKCIRERRRLRRNRLSVRQIRQLGTIVYTNENQYKTCAICLEDYDEGERLRLLPCQHMFHIKCIDPWLHDNRRTCPLCKKKIRVGQMCDDSSSSDSDDVSRSSSVTETARLIPSRDTVTSSTRIQELADAIINMIQRSSDSENEGSDIEHHHPHHHTSDPNFNSEEANLLSHVEQPATIGSVNHSESEMFVDAVTHDESDLSGIHV